MLNYFKLKIKKFQRMSDDKSPILSIEKATSETDKDDENITNEISFYNSIYIALTSASQLAFLIVFILILRQMQEPKFISEAYLLISATFLKVFIDMSSGLKNQSSIFQNIVIKLKNKKNFFSSFFKKTMDFFD